MVSTRTLMHGSRPLNFYSVFDFHKVIFNFIRKSQSVFKLFKEANHVDIFGGGKLHTCNRDNTVAFCRLEECGAVFSGIVVG